MTDRLKPDDFNNQVKSMEKQPFQNYQKLLGLVVSYPDYSIHFKHIQGSPGASPASLCQLDVGEHFLHIPKWAKISPTRTTASEDYLLRIFNEGINHCAKQNRGAEGSGSFQPVLMPQQVLKRNIISIAEKVVSIAFLISLPGSLKKKILSREVCQMFNDELPAILQYVKKRLEEEQLLRMHCECVEDMLTLQDNLASKGLIAFIGDGALLARQSGVSDLPARFQVVPFKTPQELAVEVELPNAGKIRGLGIRPGITVLIGGGYHGKSTLLTALAKSIYPHIPGDGREHVIADKSTVQICAEDGRSIKGLNISSFLNKLPEGADPNKFFTDNASGSTSEAAAIIEFVQAGAKLLLIDEDTSATNFLYRDHHMRKLIPDDPITPLFDRIRELYSSFGVSTIIVASGSSDYFSVADQVIAIREYLPVDMTAHAKTIHLQPAHKPETPLIIEDKRVLSQQNFNPAYTNERLQKRVSQRIKPLRGQELKILEYGMDRIDLSALGGIIDPAQVYTIGFFLLLAWRLQLHAGGCSPTALAKKIDDIVTDNGLGVLQPPESTPIFFAQTRVIELAGALNRLRSLSIQID